MDSTYFGLIELLLTALVCFGFGAQQLWSLRRDRIRTAREKAEAAARRDEAS